MNIVLILASGMGSRMRAGKNKIFLELNNKPLITYAISSFELSEYIDEIVIVSKKSEIKYMQEIVDKYKFKKISNIIIGGIDTRQQSAHKGVNFVYQKYKNIKNVTLLFHNGANPFVTIKEIKNVITASKIDGAAVVAHKTKDTIRKVDENKFSKGVIDRNELWNMQTPQAIQLNLAKKSFEYAFQNDFEGNDDCSIVENYGKNVKIVEASDNNFKITTPIDLELAKVILNNNKII